MPDRISLIRNILILENSIILLVLALIIRQLKVLKTVLTKIVLSVKI